MVEISLGLGIFVSAIATLTSTFLFFNYKNYSKRKKLRVIIFTELINVENTLKKQNEMFRELEENYEEDFEEIVEILDDADYSNEIFHRKDKFFPLTTNYKSDMDVLTEKELFNIGITFSLLNKREQGIQDRIHSLENEDRLTEVISLTIEGVLNQMEVEEDKLLSWSTLDYFFGSNGRMNTDKLNQLRDGVLT